MEITKEYFFSHFDVKEEDFDGIDFNAFVTYFNLTPESLEKYPPKMLIALYREMINTEPTVDYTDIYSYASGLVDEKDLDFVDCLIWEYHSGNYNDCMVIDCSKEAVYYGLGYFLNACGESNRIANFNEEDSAFLGHILEENDIVSWKNEYNGTNIGTTGSFSWAIGIRLSDGRCFCYSGYGVNNSGTPKTLRPMLEALIDHFTGQEN